MPNPAGGTPALPTPPTRSDQRAYGALAKCSQAQMFNH